MIDGNSFVNFASKAYACTLRAGYVGINYLAATALPSD
jgi:hypothetical protein